MQGSDHWTVGDQKTQRELWNDSALEYERHTRRYPAHGSISLLLMSAVTVHPRAIIDFGCGPGGSTEVIARTHPAASSIVGLDNAEKMIEVAKRRNFQHPVSFHHCEADAIATVIDRPSDLVVFSNSFFHVARKEPLLEVLRSVLAPGAQIVFSMYESVFSMTHKMSWPYSSSSRDILMKKVIDRMRVAGFDIHARAEDREQFSETTLAQLFSGAGFKLRLAGTLRLVRSAQERFSFFSIPAVAAEVFPSVPLPVVRRALKEVKAELDNIDSQERTVFSFRAEKAD